MKKKIVRKATNLIPTVSDVPFGYIYPSPDDGWDLNPNGVNPYFITGFVDGEACFIISVLKNQKLKIGWEVQVIFTINLAEKDRALLKLIQSFFNGVGSITKHDKNSLKYRVASIQDLGIVISNFDKYPLITQKKADYLLFKEAFHIVKSKNHLTTEGLHKIIAIKASLNNGLPDKLKTAFPGVLPVPRPLVLGSLCPQRIKDPSWLAGFASAEGCFMIKSQESRSGSKVYAGLVFSVSQHSRDEGLMRDLINYLGCGNYYPNLKVDKGEYVVVRFNDIESKIIPFFNKYPIGGVKALDFADFKKAADIVKVKGHLTRTGLVEILKIKEGMNTGRVVSKTVSTTSRTPFR